MAKKFLTGIETAYIKIEDEPLLATDGVNKQYVDNKIDGVFMKKIVDEVTKTLLYVGLAQPGTATSAASWSIQRIEFVGKDIFITWADAVATFTKIWDDRASYTYG